MTRRPWTGGELRWDLWASEWRIIAPGRSGRPGDTPCPFCPGTAEEATVEHWRLPGPADTWRVRAVRNLYPLSDHHEIVIEHPCHDWDLSTANDAEVGDVLAAWQNRHRVLRAGSAQVAVFRNHGVAAGISLSHPHSQVVGLPVLSAATRRDLEAAQRYYLDNNCCAAEDLVIGELASGTRVVLADESAVAFVPFAPAADFEVRLSPVAPRADFADAPGDEIASIATILRRVLAAMHAELDDPAYNLLLHTAPTGYEAAPFLSWYLSIVPRLTIPAGLELATGVPVLTRSPEQCAEHLRAALTTVGQWV
jgi:UDPglucose--hexose-1-phosphate uridylyltransferase